MLYVICVYIIVGIAVIILAPPVDVKEEKKKRIEKYHEVKKIDEIIEGEK